MRGTLETGIGTLALKTAKRKPFAPLEALVRTLWRSSRFAFAVAGACAVLSTGCRPSSRNGEVGEGAVATTQLSEFVAEAIGAPMSGRPWITDVRAVDLDADGLTDVVVCEGRLNTVSWIRQTEPGVFIETQLDDSIAGAARLAVVDFDGDGLLDLLVAGMGIITPSDAKVGSVVLLENLGEGSFRKRVLLEGVDRVADVQAGDLNGDGLLDLSAAMFGYYEGEVRWLENRGGYEFVSHILLALPGAIHVPMADMNGDGLIDIVALLSQEYEEVHVFENRGGGQFSDRVVWGSGNEDWGSSGIAVADMNRDGYPDIVYTNGDAFDYFAPVPRPWHGVQWLQNDGRGGFDSHRLGDLPGAYMPRVVDLNGDGLLDIVAVSTFNQWDREDAESLASFLQKEDGSFERRTLARSPISLLALDSADMDGDGRVELITGGFHALPPYERMSRVLWWRPQE